MSVLETMDRAVISALLVREPIPPETVEVLHYIAGAEQPPTSVEIAAHFGWRPHVAVLHVERLGRRGVVRCVRKRGYVIVPPERIGGAA